MPSTQVTQAQIKDTPIHSRVIFPSTTRVTILVLLNSNKSKGEIVNSQIILFSQEQPANHIKIQIYSELKVVVNLFKSLLRTRRISGRGNPIPLQGQMLLVMMKQPSSKMMERFINQFQLVKKIDGVVLYLPDHSKIPQIEKS